MGHEKLNQIREAIKSNLSKLLTILIVISLAMTIFTRAAITNGITQELIVNWVLGFIASTFVFIIWIKDGKLSAVLLDKFKTARKRYNITVLEILKNKLINKMPDFCKKKTEENIENTRMLALQKKGYYAKETETFKSIDVSTLTDKQRLLYKRLENKTKTVIILPNQLYCNSNAKALHNATDYSKQNINIKLIIRIATSLVITGFMATVLFDGAVFTFAKVVQMLMYICVLISCIYIGYDTGYKSVSIDEVDAYIRKTRLNEAFLIENGCEIILPEDGNKNINSGGTLE